MKKVILLILVLSLVLSLYSCSIVDYIINGKTDDVEICFEYEDLISGMTYVQIADWKQTSDEVIVLKEFTYEESLVLLYDFSQITYTTYIPIYGGPPGPNGVCIKVFYEDGDWDFYSYYGTNTMLRSYCSQKVYYDLISKYLGYEISE
ncbi:MAG: hypothetical protein IJD79_07115 [Clostridia bacterium]|nr:hypothetical protein [Clostridia bacterium]